MKRIVFFDIIIFLYVVLFLYAAMTKLTTFDLFQAQISKSPLIMGHAKWISILVPASEILIAIGLVIPRFQLPSLFAAFTLMFIFTAYITFIITLSPYVPCSCGGILNSLGWTEHLIFNIGFILLSVLGIVLHNKRTNSHSVATFQKM